MDIFQDDFVKNGKHTRWVSLNKTNPFAFAFDYHFWHDKIDLKLNNKLKKLLLKKKQYNINNKNYIDQTIDNTYWITNINIFIYLNLNIV